MFLGFRRFTTWRYTSDSSTNLWWLSEWPKQRLIQWLIWEGKNQSQWLSYCCYFLRFSWMDGLQPSSKSLFKWAWDSFTFCIVSFFIDFSIFILGNLEQLRLWQILIWFAIRLCKTLFCNKATIVRKQISPRFWSVNCYCK